MGLVLAGCAPSPEDELRQWMADQRRKAVPRVTPLAEPKRYVPMAYTQAHAADPFSVQKLTQALRREMGSEKNGNALLMPEINRRKEPLESYPLDAMTLVGSMDRNGQKVALVKVDNLLYQVYPGHHLGQNFGRVTRITESEVTLREIVQDAAGEWIERAAALQLQEKTK